MDLSAWNAALLSDLRARQDPARLLYLYVDREVLARLHGGTPDSAVADFCAAFRPVPDRPFFGAVRKAQAWRRQGFEGDPPLVAHLALTVLAVTEDPVGAAHGVYRQQNLLLGLPPEAKEPPGYGEDVPTLWSVWNQWLEHDGRLGRPSARTHPHWTLQGWSRSQGLIRLGDRVQLERFVEAVGPGEDDRTRLLLLLRQWLTYRGKAAEALLVKINDDAAAEVVADVLTDEIQRYQSHGARTRSARSRGLLVVDDWTGYISAALVVTADLVGVALDVNGERYVVEELDEYVSLTIHASPATTLREGATVGLGQGRMIRVGGDSCYVFRDEPQVSGRLQATAAAPWAPSHVLVHSTHLEAVLTGLQEVDINTTPRPGPVESWHWLENIALTRDSQALRLLGLAPGLPESGAQPALVGGLPVAGQHYLVGGEPDLVLSTPELPVLLDDQPLDIRGRSVVPLCEAAPDPGAHHVVTGDWQLSFRTSSWLREQAHDAGLWRPAVDAGRGVLKFAEAQRAAVTGPRLSGALLRDMPVAEPLTTRRQGEQDVLALLEDGSLLELYPSTPQWLAVQELHPNLLDVFHALRTTSPRPAFLLLRNRRTHALRAANIPESADLIPGTTPHSARGDLVHDLVRDWGWIGPAAERRRQEVLGRALNRTSPVGRVPRPAPQPAPRRDVVSGMVPNPYDDVLQWLSERETARSSAAQFAAAWAWSCHKNNHPDLATHWRRALRTLSRLGHVERDYRRQQVGAAAATMMSLPTAAGLSVLTGARPLRLLERLNDPDAVDVVGEAASSWMLHLRTPLGQGRTPLGPATVYVEWDEQKRSAIDVGLDELGVTRTGLTADRLLKEAASAKQELEAGTALLLSPSREMFHLERTAARYSWHPRRQDIAPGLYRYRLPHGNVFAWRTSEGALHTCSPATGRWLAHAAEGATHLLVHQPVTTTLLVPTDTPLPEMLDRAVTLRSGLAPFTVHNHQVEGRGAGRDYVGYVNVDARSADHLAALLGQRVEIDTTPLKREP